MTRDAGPEGYKKCKCERNEFEGMPVPSMKFVIGAFILVILLSYFL